MKEERQRFAIAEACGWRDIHHTSSPFGIAPDDMNIYSLSPTTNYYTRLPDYLNDLNAMHEAEKLLGYGDHAKPPPTLYINCLYEVLDRANQHEAGGLEVLSDREITTLLIHATAAQRAEAFLRTLGKWKD